MELSSGSSASRGKSGQVGHSAVESTGGGNLRYDVTEIKPACAKGETVR